MEIRELKNDLVLKWNERKFREYFFRTLGIYAALLLLEYLAGIGTVGLFAAIASIILLVLIGRSIHQNRDSLRPNAVRSFWIFIALMYALFSLRSPTFLLLLASLGFFNPILIFSLITILSVAFWVIFFLFWSKEAKLPIKTFAYISALSLYFVFHALFLMGFLLVI